MLVHFADSQLISITWSKNLHYSRFSISFCQLLINLKINRKSTKKNSFVGLLEYPVVPWDNKKEMKWTKEEGSRGWIEHFRTRKGNLIKLEWESWVQLDVVCLFPVHFSIFLLVIFFSIQESQTWTWRSITRKLINEPSKFSIARIVTLFSLTNRLHVSKYDRVDSTDSLKIINLSRVIRKSPSSWSLDCQCFLFLPGFTRHRHVIATH